jgi:hypothetical protein
MGIDYRVSEDGTLVWTRVSQDVGEGEIVDHVAALVADSRINSGFRELVDGTATRHVQFDRETGSQVAEIHRRHADRFRGSRVALVIQDLQVYETAKLMEEMHAAPPVLIVFYSMDVAKIWLGCEGERDPFDESAP